MRSVERWQTWLFYSLIACTVLDRLHVLLLFGFNYTGTDDTVIWNIARDFANGLFREPYMYGQDYNPMLEALIAAPFMRLGAQPWIALPIVTSLLALLPFWSWALWHWRRKEPMAAMVFAAMPLLLPVEWGLSTTITRGIIHGLALLAPLPWLLGSRASIFRFFLASLFACAALLCNPNAFVLLITVYCGMFVVQWRSVRFWCASVVGAVPAALYWWHGSHFFDTHPWDVTHTIDPAELVFDPALFARALTDLDTHFKSLAPLWWPNGYFVLLAIVLVVVLLFRKRLYPQACGALIALGLMLFALGTGKAHNGCGSVFFPLSRLFFAAPLVLAWCIAGLVPCALVPARIAPFVLTLLVTVTTVKWYRLPDVLQHELAQQGCALAPVEPLEGIFDRCRVIGTVARSAGAEVVVPIRWPRVKQDPAAHFRAYFLCYTCSFVVPDMPPTFGPGYDRRCWVHDRYAHRPADRVLFVGGDPHAWERARAGDLTITREHDGDPLLHFLFSDPRTIDTLSIQLGVDDHILH